MKHSIVLIAMSLSVMLTGTASAVKIAEKGNSHAIVVVAEGATKPERHAAAELADFLGQVTGAQFSVVCQPGDAKSRLLVGPGAARLADADFTTEGLGTEGLIIRTVGNDLILAGGRPRGTLYAVYAFLEDHVGCRWWSSKVSTIPSRPTLKVDHLDIRAVPALEYREPFWFDAFDGDWAVRNKVNGHRAGLDARRGGQHVYEGFVHTFYALIPPGKYFDEHPEWFSEIGGARVHKGAQLCLTNEQMRGELVKNLKRKLRANPSATIASVSQNDSGGSCQCAACAAVDREEGSPSGAMLRFVNAVAAEVEKEFPHVAISTLAYQYTRKPPRLVRPRPNVIVRLCSIECSFSKPLSDERNRAFRDDIVGWSKICDRLYIWDYTTNFAHYVSPHPNLRVLGPNVSFFAKHGAKGVFEQGAYQSRGAEMAELRAWVLAKLLWDPGRDADSLIDEFLAGYYGQAAQHMRAYLNIMHDAVDASGDYLGCYSPVDAAFLSLPTLCAAAAHLDAAEAAVQEDADIRQRVKVARLPIMYIFLMRWQSLREAAESANVQWPVAQSQQALHKEFMQVAKSAGITHIREHAPGFGALTEALQRH
ncbi:MAG: DUF4838 domain-containing protein [Phycisphaerales bacterium]|nr:MAG: DUF4838 domain-containing protein [Phycisphaerales bacterium]